MKKYLRLIFFILCVFALVTCTPCVDLDADNGMVYVEGATINGAIKACGRTESKIFKDGTSITIPNLYVCDHEVTQKEFSVYYPNYEYIIERNHKAVGDNYPAYDVNWYDALLYCNKRSIAEGFTPCYTVGGERNPEKWGKVPFSDDFPNYEEWNKAECDFSANGYRLPTVAEWEYIARGGNKLKDYQYLYAGSNDLDEVAWWGGNTDFVEKVKQKKPNSLGIYDMSGNLDEWCWERDGSDILRCYSGGYYYYPGKDNYFLSKGYSSGFLTRRNSQLGFRVVRTAN